MISIVSFQAIDGDCIWIRFGENKITNIVIDLGRVGTYKTSIKKIINLCREKNENIDLLIITHVDSDHIKGVNQMVKDSSSTNLIKKVWFNCPNNLIYNKGNDYISYQEGMTAVEFFKKNNIEVLNDINNSIDIIKFNESSITILSPDIKDMERNNQEWLKTDYISGEKRDWENTLEELYNKNLGIGESITNRSSIAFIFEHKDKKIALLGDSSPTVIENKLKTLGYSKNNPINLDLMKLSHHGSKYSINLELLELIECDNFLISSNGKNLSKNTLSKIIVLNSKKGKCNTTIYFNYEELIYENLFLEKDFEQYKFRCIYGDNKNSGVEISY